MADKRTVTVERMTGQDVGCKRDAIAAYEGTLKVIGAGAMRTVYANAKRDTVYKISKRGKSPNRNGDNESEYERIKRIMATPGCRTIATPVALFYVDGVAILAMPMRPRHSDETPIEQRDKYIETIRLYNRTNKFGDHVGDMHGGNYRGTPRGRLRVTDCGDVRW